MHEPVLSDQHHDHDPQNGVSRRSLLSRSAASGLGIALVGSLEGLFGASAAAEPDSGRGKPGEAGYGPLVPDPKGILSLPAGFGYTLVAQSGVTTLESGEPTPDDPTAPRRSSVTGATAACS
jgi:hypothetical protein